MRKRSTEKNANVKETGIKGLRGRFSTYSVGSFEKSLTEN